MLKLENIKKIYNEGTVSETIIFENFNLEVRKNEFVTVIGSNGSGKSTLLNIICGTTDINGGKIFLNENNLTGTKEYNRSKHLGRVFQNPSLGTCPSMTVLENMALADNKNKRFDLSFGINKKRINFYRDELLRLNLGLEDKLNVKVGLLSGGQRQAISLLMCTLTKIDCLILDEHTAALDPKTSDNIIELTNEIVRKNNIMTIMVTHNLRHAVKYGNRLIMMHKGEAILDLSGEEKDKIKIDDLLNKFFEISIESGNSI